MKFDQFPLIRLTALAALVVFFVQCKSRHEFDISKLEGTWMEDPQKDYAFTEIWKGEKNGLNGQGMEINQGINRVTENLQIIEENNQYVYKATVIEQNGGSTVSFPAIAESENEIIFENMQHDFPQNIQYKIISPDQLQITVSAKAEGQKQEFVLNMKRK
jgi:hypothetical protein